MTAVSRAGSTNMKDPVSSDERFVGFFYRGAATVDFLPGAGVASLQEIFLVVVGTESIQILRMKSKLRWDFLLK